MPHDVPGLIELFGSNQEFCFQLEYFFNHSESDPFNVLPNPYYWAANDAKKKKKVGLFLT